MTTNLSPKDELTQIVSIWRLQTLVNELLRTSNTSFCALDRLQHIKNDLPDMSLLEIESVILTFELKSRTIASNESRIFKKIKALSILRFEILRNLRYKSERQVSLEKSQYILNVLNSKIEDSDDLQALFVKCYKVIDIILPNQYKLFYSALENKDESLEALSVSNKLYGYTKFSKSYPDVSIERIQSVIETQRKICAIFNLDGECTSTLRKEADNYIRFINWVPQDIVDFDQLHTTLSDIDKGLHFEIS